jgi:hypothetical protein
LPIRRTGAWQIDFKVLANYLNAKPERIKYYKKIRHISSLLPSFFDGILAPFIAVSD